MIACAAASIIMGKQSSLGPIDPQIQNVPAIGALAELDKAALISRKTQRSWSFGG